MTNKTYPIFLISVIGFAFGAGLLLFQAQSTTASKTFVDKSEFAVWLFLIGVTCVVMFMTPFVLSADLRTLWNYGRSKRLDLGISIFLVTLMYLIPILFTRSSEGPPIKFPLVYHSQKIGILYVLGFMTTVIPSVLGIWLIRQGLVNDFQEVKPTADTLRRYHYYRNLLQRFIMILGVLVALVTLDTGALRNAVIAVSAATPLQFPVISVLVFGAYFTIMLVILYLPTYNTLMEAGKRIRDAYAPLPEPMEADWDKALNQRKILEESLQLHLSAQQYLQTSVFILAPMLSGIISVLLE